MKKKDIMVGNFLGGMAWGIGSVLGATIVVAILVGILQQANYLPFAENVTRQIQKR